MSYSASTKAYRQAAHTVSKTRQVVMLYDGVIRNLNQIKEAIKENRIEDRYNKLIRTSDIISGLQMSLDFEYGRDVAQTLYDFYSSVDMRLIQLHRYPKIEVLDEIIAEIREMRDLWDHIDKGNVNAQGAVDPNVHAAPTDAQMVAVHDANGDIPSSPTAVAFSA